MTQELEGRSAPVRLSPAIMMSGGSATIVKYQA